MKRPINVLVADSNEKELETIVLNPCRIDQDNILKAVSEQDPDVVVLDISKGENKWNIDYLDTIRGILDNNPNLPILAISDDVRDAGVCLRNGVRGYIETSKALDNIMRVIKALNDNETYISEDILKKNPQILSENMLIDYKDIFNSKVSNPKKFEIFKLLGKGYSAQEISDEMNLVVRTVDKYVRDIAGKFGNTSEELRVDSTLWMYEHDQNFRNDCNALLENNTGKLKSLTELEIKTFKLIGEGKTIKEIAFGLDRGISRGKYYCTHIKRILGFEDKGNKQLIKYAALVVNYAPDQLVTNITLRLNIRDYMARGFTCKEIVKETNVKKACINRHIQNIASELGAQDPTEARIMLTQLRYQTNERFRNECDILLGKKSEKLSQLNEFYRKIFNMIGERKHSKEIAPEINRGIWSVNRYRSNIWKALDLNNNEQLTMYAGLVVYVK